MHLGHRRVLARTVEAARERGCTSAVFTFAPPLDRAVKGRAILTPEEKARRIAAMGVEHYVRPPFEEFCTLSPEAFAALAFPFSKLAGTALEEKWPLIAPLLQQRVEKLTDIPEKIGFLSEQPDYSAELFRNKKSKATPETAKAALEALIPEFEALEAWDVESLNAVMTRYAETQGVKIGQPMWAIRIGVSGLAVTPGGPSEIMTILGREESLRRLQLARQK